MISTDENHDDCPHPLIDWRGIKGTSIPDPFDAFIILNPLDYAYALYLYRLAMSRLLHQG